MSATLGAKAGATLRLARLLVELANADFLLDPATLYQLPKPTDSLLGRLFVTQCQLNHAELPFVRIDFAPPTRPTEG